MISISKNVLQLRVCGNNLWNTRLRCAVHIVAGAMVAGIAIQKQGITIVITDRPVHLSKI